MPKKQVFWAIKNARKDKVKGIKGISRDPAIPVLHMPLLSLDYEILYDSAGHEVLVVMTDEPVLLNMIDENNEEYDTESFQADFADGVPVRPE